MLRILFPLFLVFVAPAALAREITDSTRTQVTLKDSPRRIVTLAPSLAELAADLLGEDLQRIVGVSEYTDYPPALKKVSSIGSYSRFNLEKVLSLKPDLVLATFDGNSEDQVLHLRELGVPVVVVSTGDVSEIEESFRMVARALDREERGAKLLAEFEAGIGHIRAQAKARADKGTPPCRVLLQLGDNPLIVVGGHTFLDEALKLIGANNVYGDMEAHYPRPSLEDAIHRDPDTILVLALGDNGALFSQMARRWTSLKSLQAVAKNRVRVLRVDELLRPSMRLLEGLSRLEHAVYEQP